MGVPGPVTSAPSGGVHQLIRTGGGRRWSPTGDEVLELVGARGSTSSRSRGARSRRATGCPIKQQQVLDAVPVATGATADSIARVAGLALPEVTSALARLHAAGLVEQDADGWRLAALGSARERAPAS